MYSFETKSHIAQDGLELSPAKDDLDFLICLCLLSAGVIGVCHHTQYGDWTQGFMHVRHLPYQLSYSPSHWDLSKWTSVTQLKRERKLKNNSSLLPLYFQSSKEGINSGPDRPWGPPLYNICFPSCSERRFTCVYVSGPGLGSGWCVSTCDLLVDRVLRQHRGECICV